ncbi:hypothetical protein ABZ135_36870 [Streptomyces sp. NPDC006339]|uniref:hypothetical protein n=1 Tax=Streptomyces sp. NPDC006339 TaxID=3156755 RepID=UPI0033A8A4A2
MTAGGGTRTSIAAQLSAATVGNEVEPEKRTVQAQLSPPPSRQVDEKTNSLPAVSHFTPPATTDPDERLAYCEGAILHAERETELATERITQQYLLWVGEPYRIVRDEDLYRRAGYQTFDAWGRALNGRSGDYMNKIIRISPVVQALSTITRRQLKEQPLRPLISVQREHGDEAVRMCWRKAEAAGDLTERGLRHAAVALRYKAGPPEPASPDAAPQALTSSALLNLPRLKRLAATDPVKALALCQSVREELDAFERALSTPKAGN